MPKSKSQPKSLHISLKEKLQNYRFTQNLTENINLIKTIFKDVDLMQYRPITACDTYQFCFIFSEGVVNSSIIFEHIIKPLMLAEHLPKENLLDYLKDNILQIGSVKKTDDLYEIVKNLSYGESILLAEGTAEALLLDTKSFESRSISEPEGEKIQSGPREGFSEVLMKNLSLIRRRLRTSDLKLKYYNIGEKSNTQLCIAYIDGIAEPKILAELYRRLEKINIDAVLDANYIIELIRDKKRSLFPSTGYTERPDVVAAKLLEGRIAIFVDGTPVVLTVPYLFIENFQSNEDYYLNYYYASFSRLLRIIGFFLSITVPALYVAVIGYHHEVLPTTLMINVATDSHNVPFPTALEAFLLLLMFDILRETGIRMPLGVGQALSIVGALVVGSSAVEANLVSSPMIIITAISGITSLLIVKMNASIIVIRFLLLFSASCLGMFGLIIGLAILYIHILSLESFGIPQLTRDRPTDYQQIKDTVIRAPWWQMLLRPDSITNNERRLKMKR